MANKNQAMMLNFYDYNHFRNMLTFSSNESNELVCVWHIMRIGRNTNITYLNRTWNLKQCFFLKVPGQNKVA